MHNSASLTMLIMKKIVSLICLLMTAVAFSGMNDKVLRFSTPGPDRYADGSIVADGECYALVWSPKGKTFSGFNADGTPVSSSDFVVLAAPLAQNGRCIDSIFQVPAEEYEELKNGEWAVCLVDTRMANGVPAGVRDSMPLRVNRWGLVKGGVKEAPTSISNLRLAASSGASAGSSAKGGTSLLSATGETDGGTASQSVCANNASALPPSIPTPSITAIEVSDGEVWLGVTDTVPYLSYTIISGSEPGALKTDYFAEVIDGGNGGEIAIGTVQSPTRRFFKVKRAE